MGAQTALTSASFCGMHKQIDDRQRVIDGLTVETCTESGAFQWRTPAYDEIMKFYTGLPSIKVLKAVLRLVNKACPSYFCCGKPFVPFQEFMATIVKHCLNSLVQVLAYCLIVSCAILYHKCFWSVWQQWTNAYACSLNGLIVKYYGRLCQNAACFQSCWNENCSHNWLFKA